MGAPMAQCRMQNAECRMNAECGVCDVSRSETRLLDEVQLWSAECAMFVKQTRQVRRSLTLGCGMRAPAAQCRMQNCLNFGVLSVDGTSFLCGASPLPLQTSLTYAIILRHRFVAIAQNKTGNREFRRAFFVGLLVTFQKCTNIQIQTNSAFCILHSPLNPKS